MGRRVGEFGAVEALPELVVVVAAAVTQLADTWFVFALLAAVYWFLPRSLAPAPRRTGAVLIALATTTLALVTLIKVGVGVPRPPGAAHPAVVPGWLPGALGGWFESTTSADGFGFPSGHAAGATVTYVGLALLSSGWTRRRRLALGGAVAAAVGLSRIALEVHYLVDFLAGVALALVVLYAGLRLAGDDGFGTGDRSAVDPTPLFLAAALVSAVAAAVALGSGEPAAGTALDGAIGVGTGLGGAAGWQVCAGDEPTVPPLIAGPALVISGTLWLGVLAADPSPVPAVLMAAAGTFGILATPAAGARIRD